VPTSRGRASGNRGNTCLRATGDGFGAEKSACLASALGGGFSAGDLGRIRELLPEGSTESPTTISLHISRLGSRRVLSLLSTSMTLGIGAAFERA